MQPLARRLPLTVASLFALMMGVILYQGFRRVDDLAAEVAVAHLQTSSHQLRSALQTSAARLRRDMGVLSRSPAIEQAASVFASEADRRAAAGVLKQEMTRNAQGIAAIGLWSREGRLLVAVGDTSLARLSPPRLTEIAGRKGDTARAAIGPLVARGDSIFVSVVGHVRDQSGALQASIVEVRHSSRNSAALDLLRGLVGPDARILLGNARDSVWSDFSRRVRVGVTPADSSAGEHRSDGVAFLHSIEPIAGTPWRILVEVPRHWATARAGRVILEIGTLAVFMLVAGVGIVWLAIHRSLRPLERVTASVERLAHGDLGERVRVSSDDEFGKLASAFNSMAEQVEDSTRQLASRATALETANRELEESRERYRLLVDYLPDGVLVHRAGRVTFANSRAAQLLGLTSGDELVGSSMVDLAEGNDLPAIAPATVGGSSIREVKLRRADMKRVLVEATDILVAHSGQLATQTIWHDVTQQRLLEEELRHAQKMDAVGRLAGGVAHDFNNILTVIDAHAEFAMNAAEPEATRLADIAEIRQASAAAARLTRQLLAFSRKQAITPVELDLNSIVRGFQTMLGRVIGQNIVIRSELAEPLWMVRADAGYLEQVIMNLAVNARDAMRDGGNLDLRTSNLEIGPDYRTPAGELVPQGQYALLSVEDSGMGIPEDIQSRVFEPFFTTKPAGQGTGLGLSTVYGIVKQLGGFIWLYSELGRGTSFKILLPRSIIDPREPSIFRTNEHRIQALNARILLVEDQAAVRAPLARGLRNAGFIVDESADAETAERFLEGADRYDLIVSDMMMPGKTGAELAAGVIGSGETMPIIIMSGYSEDFSNREWKLPQNVVFLDKPVAPSELIRVINRLLT